MPSIIGYLESCDVPASFGRAAKLIAIYLKGMVILTGNAETSQARVFHPPIDGILLRNMCKATDVQSAHKTSWRKLKWTALSEDEYYRLIDQLRMCIVEGEPFLFITFGGAGFMPDCLEWSSAVMAGAAAL